MYLRGRYEVQVEYEPADENDKFHGMGSIYGFLPPMARCRRGRDNGRPIDVTLVA